jgi:glycoprotein endo-alpha-1,2-mannosidase
MRKLLALLLTLAGMFFLSLSAAKAAPVQRAAVQRQVLAFYYGWYGTPGTSGRWVHWRGVDRAHSRINDATDYPVSGPYDSHNPAEIDRQVALARAEGISGFIASWWGRGDFTDQGMPLLLAAARRHGFVISAYYENIAGRSIRARERAAIADLNYIVGKYGANSAYLHVAGKPVVFIYGRALRELSPAGWRAVVTQVRRDNPGGVALIAPAVSPAYVALFDGVATYNVTAYTKNMTPTQLRAWARANYPRMVAAAGHKISTVTVIPGFDDRELGRPAPRPVTPRWGGETYQVLWQEAIAAHPDYVLITSWNEWHEGSEIEPSLQYGSRILEETKAFSEKFLQGK